MYHYPAENVQRGDWRERAIRGNGHIGQLTRSVAAYTRAIHDAPLEVDISRDHRQQHGAAHTRAIGRLPVDCVEGTAGRYHAATKRAVRKKSLDPEHLVVTPTWVQCSFYDDIWCLVRCHSDAGQEAAASANVGKVHEDAVHIPWDIAAGRERRRIFDRNAQPQRLVKVLHEPDLPGAGKVEANNLI